MIEHEGRMVCTKYIHYHHQVTYPEINGTMGINWPIHITNLQLPKEYKGQEVLTLPEQKIFDPQMQMQDKIDSALNTLMTGLLHQKSPITGNTSNTWSLNTMRPPISATK